MKESPRRARARQRGREVFNTAMRSESLLAVVLSAAPPAVVHALREWTAEAYVLGWEDSGLDDVPYVGPY